MRKIIKQISKNKKKGAFNRAKDRVDFVSGDAQETDIAKTKYRVASCQSTGKARPNNEDTLLTLNTYISGLDMPIAFGFYLVADGMGGHQSGEIASNYAAQGISQYLMSHVSEYTFLSGEPSPHLIYANILKMLLKKRKHWFFNEFLAEEPR